MRKISAILILTLIMMGCSKRDDEGSSSSLSVNVTTPTNITLTSATSGGSVSDSPDETVTSKGVCWSTNPGPDINDSRTNEGAGAGSFVSELNSLEPGTTYYVRAYAQSSGGVSYSSEVSFTTLGDCLESTFDGDMFLNTQSDVNSFGSNNYCAVTGSLIIAQTPNGSNDPIVDLSPLGSIQIIRYLGVQFTQVLENLDGLENLQEITERLSVYENLELRNIDALRNVTAPMNNVNIERNDKLENIDGLSGLSSLVAIPESRPGLLVIDNAALQNVDGLRNLSSMEGGALFIWLSPLITNLDGLSNIPGTIDELVFSGNEALTNIDGLSHLTALTGDLEIGACGSLKDLSGLKGLTSIGGRFQLGFNRGLTSLEGLSGLSTVGGELRLVNNDFLLNIDDLSGLTSLGSLDIEGEGSITNVDGLINVTSIAGDLEITRTTITDFCGLETVVNAGGIGGDYIVEQNEYNPTLQDILDGNCSL